MHKLFCPACEDKLYNGRCVNSDCRYYSYNTASEFKKDSKDNNFSKPLAEELIPQFLMDMAKVLQYGGNKYGYQNWRKATSEDYHHYEGAVLRHFLTWQSGDKLDKDTDLSHLVHAAINLMFLYWHTEVKNDI